MDQYSYFTKYGSKYWRLEYRFNGKRKSISFGKEGKHPDISISDARSKPGDAKKLLAKGIDPSEARKNKYDADNNADSFEYITTLWQQKNTDWSEGYRKDVLSRLTTYVYPSDRRIASYATVLATQLSAKIQSIEIRSRDRAKYRYTNQITSLC